MISEKICQLPSALFSRFVAQVSAEVPCDSSDWESDVDCQLQHHDQQVARPCGFVRRFFSPTGINSVSTSSNPASIKSPIVNADQSFQHEWQSRMGARRTAAESGEKCADRADAVKDGGEEFSSQCRESKPRLTVTDLWTCSRSLEFLWIFVARSGFLPRWGCWPFACQGYVRS